MARPAHATGRLHRTPSGGVKHLLHALDGGGLVDLLDRREFADEAVKGRLVDLALAVRLLGLPTVAMKVTEDLGDRSGVAGIDLRLVFLGAPTPHSAARLGAALQLGEGGVHLLAGRQPTQTGALCLAHRHAQGHPVLLEMDDEHVQCVAGNLLHLDRVDLADAVGRIDHKVTGSEGRLLRHPNLSQNCRRPSTDAMPSRSRATTRDAATTSTSRWAAACIEPGHREGRASRPSVFYSTKRL